MDKIIIIIISHFFPFEILEVEKRFRNIIDSYIVRHIDRHTAHHRSKQYRANVSELIESTTLERQDEERTVVGMKEQKASDIATGGETASAKQTTNANANRVVAAMDTSAKMTSATSISTSTASSTKLLVEGDTSNGGPKAAAALLSLGQDLTKGDTAVLASAAALVVPRAQLNNNPMELVATRDIPMLPIDIGTKSDRTGAVAIATTMNTNTNNSDANKMKRKRNESKATKNNLGNPPDLLLWLSPGEKIGNWDVLCGRGGE
jgi:hypothetical protein